MACTPGRGPTHVSVLSLSSHERHTPSVWPFCALVTFISLSFLPRGHPCIDFYETGSPDSTPKRLLCPGLFDYALGGHGMISTFLERPFVCTSYPSRAAPSFFTFRRSSSSALPRSPSHVHSPIHRPPVDARAGYSLLSSGKHQTRSSSIFSVHPSMVYRLLCPHPNCPITFKSKRGQTHHIRTVHFWPLNRQINVQRDQEYDDNGRHWEDQEYEGHHHQSMDRDPSPHSRSSVSPVNNLGPALGRRNEHSHLTGM